MIIGVDLKSPLQERKHYKEILIENYLNNPIRGIASPERQRRESFKSIAAGENGRCHLSSPIHLSRDLYPSMNLNDDKFSLIGKKTFPGYRHSDNHKEFGKKYFHDQARRRDIVDRERRHLLYIPPETKCTLPSTNWKRKKTMIVTDDHHSTRLSSLHQSSELTIEKALTSKRHIHDVRDKRNSIPFASNGDKPYKASEMNGSFFQTPGRLIRWTITIDYSNYGSYLLRFLPRFK
jgi:hypothetical protein